MVPDRERRSARAGAHSASVAAPGALFLGARPGYAADMLTDTHRTNLVAALLAVNDFPLSRAYALMPAFGAAGLLDPATVAALPQPALIEAMRAAGYQRGGFLPILSFRLYALMEALVAGSLDSLPGLALSGDKSSFVATLSAVPGFGPRTSENAWVLFTTPG